MKKGIITCLVILAVFVVGYGAGIGYFAERFQPNTIFAGMDISQQSYDEAKQLIAEEMAEKEMTITENGQEIGTIKINELDPTYHIDDILQNAYQSQNPNLWLTNFFDSDTFDVNLSEYVEVDENALNQALTDIGLSNSERTPSENASIEYSEVEGYYVEDAVQGDQLDNEKVNQLILENISKGESQTDINQAYLEPEITSEDEVIQNVMNQINEATDMTLTLTIGDEQEVIDREQIVKWLGFDANNQMTFDYEAIYDYLGTLNERYASYDKPREFQSTLQGTVTVPPGTLGWSIDRENETEQIISDLKNGQDVTREPFIVGTGYTSGGLGGTYVEVDIANQMMFYYENGNKILETAVVTGQVGTDTVPGAYAIWGKESPADLKGYNPRTQSEYTQPVQYWMPFDDTGQGIHDANWQGSFGGDTYQYAGSLGCINTPPAMMAEFFNHIEVGTPVIVF